MHRLLTQFLIDNERDSKKYCEICGEKFQRLVKQQHQCKKCFRAICQKCGPTREVVFASDGTSEPHRTCTVCCKENQFIKNFIGRYKLNFSQDSQFIEEWLRKLNKQRKSYQQIMSEYSDGLTINNQNIIRFKRQSRAMFDQLIPSYNYSFRHFILSIISNLNTRSFEQKIQNTMIAIYARLKNISYVNQLVYIVIFMLCFSSQAHTYFIITRLIEKIYPQYLRVKNMKKDNLLLNEIKVLIEMYRIAWPKVDRGELDIVSKYLQSRFSGYIQTFTLNICGIMNSFVIIDEMLKTGSYLSFYKGVVGLIANCRQEVSDFKDNSKLQIFMLRNVKLQELKRTMVQFEHFQQKFQISHDVFDSAEHRKLFQKFKQLQSLYKKSQETMIQKDLTITNLKQELSQRKQYIKYLTEDIGKLQIQILFYSDKLPQLLKLDEVISKNEKLIQNNKQLTEQYLKYKNLYQLASLDKNRIQKQSIIWAKMEQSYTQQLTQLKTKNQIYQIQIAARDISFNTSVIQRKFEEKNNQIAELTKKLNVAQTDLQYFQRRFDQETSLKSVFGLLFKNNSGSRLSTQSSNGKNHHKNEQFDISKYNTQMQISKSVINKLQIAIKQLEQKVKLQDQQLKQLRKKCTIQQQQIKRQEQFSFIINQIKEQYTYHDQIESISRLIAKEENFIKKHTLESIKQSFIKCQKQLKYRAMDGKIKQMQILNATNSKKQQQVNNQSNGQLNNLLSIIKLEENQNINDDPKQCLIM